MWMRDEVWSGCHGVRVEEEGSMTCTELFNWSLSSDTNTTWGLSYWKHIEKSSCQ